MLLHHNFIITLRLRSIAPLTLLTAWTSPNSSRFPKFLLNYDLLFLQSIFLQWKRFIILLMSRIGIYPIDHHYLLGLDVKYIHEFAWPYYEWFRSMYKVSHFNSRIFCMIFLFGGKWVYMNDRMFVWVLKPEFGFYWVWVYFFFFFGKKKAKGFCIFVEVVICDLRSI